MQIESRPHLALKKTPKKVNKMGKRENISGLWFVQGQRQRRALQPPQQLNGDSGDKAWLYAGIPSGWKGGVSARFN